MTEKMDWEKQQIPEWWLTKEEWVKKHKPKTTAPLKEKKSGEVKDISSP